MYDSYNRFKVKSKTISLRVNEKEEKLIDDLIRLSSRYRSPITKSELIIKCLRFITHEVDLTDKDNILKLFGSYYYFRDENN